MRNTKKAFIEKYINKNSEELIDLPTFIDARVNGAVIGGVESSIDLRKHILNIKLKINSTVKSKVLATSNKSFKKLERIYNALLANKPISKTQNPIWCDDFSKKLPGPIKGLNLKRYGRTCELVYQTNKDIEDALCSLGKLV